jgi:hypothetical protein
MCRVFSFVAGKILDGRNRYRAAAEAGRVDELEWHKFDGTEQEARDLAKLLNDDRRHMGRDERRDWVAKLRAQGLSTRAIADAVGAAQSTVCDDLKSGERNRSPVMPQQVLPPRPIPQPESKPAPVVKEDTPKVTGIDGKKYPAKRPETRPASKPAAAPTAIKVENLAETSHQSESAQAPRSEFITHNGQIHAFL